MLNAHVKNITCKMLGIPGERSSLIAVLRWLLVLLFLFLGCTLAANKVGTISSHVKLLFL